jgi:zinc protease
MLEEPRFDAAAVERMRAQLTSDLKRESNRPAYVASLAWWAAAFPDHPYGRPERGTPETLAKITVDDLKSYHRHVFARDGLKVALVGDIDAAAAGKLLDSVFGGSGLARSDPDFMAAYIVNYILGGGSFSSRLYNEVREKRGLAYSIYQSLVWLEHAAATIGGTATRSGATASALAIVEQEINRMREQGPTADELAKAKSFLKGSYALNLDTSTKIAAQLVQIQIDNLGIDYIERRDRMIDAVTLDDARRVAKRLFEGGILVAIAGRPQGLTPKSPGN